MYPPGNSLPEHRRTGRPRRPAGWPLGQVSPIEAQAITDRFAASIDQLLRTPQTTRNPAMAPSDPDPPRAGSDAGGDGR